MDCAIEAAGIRFCQYVCHLKASAASVESPGTSTILDLSSSFIMLSLFRHMLAKLLALQKNFLASAYSITWKFSSQRLTIIDHRTGRQYEIPISYNSVQALDFQAIRAGNDSSLSSQTDGGLRVLDPGFRNTAVMKSQVTFV